MGKLFWINTIAVSALTLVAAACAPAATPAPEKAPAQPAAPAPAAAPAPKAPAAPPAAPAPAAPQPKRGGILQIATDRTIPGLDPANNIAGTAHQKLSLIYAKLVYYAVPRRGTETTRAPAVILPDLAEKWDISPDGLTYTFHLRKGLKWPDVPPLNGREFTSDDVVFTILRLRDDPISLEKAKFSFMKEVKALDKYTVQITIDWTHPNFLVNLGTQPAWILPREIVEQKKTKDWFVGGLGPFSGVKFDPENVFEVKRNANYFNADKVYLEGVVETIIRDASARVAAFRGGKLDVSDVGAGMGSPGGAKSNFEALRKENPNYKWETLPGCSSTAVVIRYGMTGPLGDPRVRRAINHLIDREAIQKVQDTGAAFPGASFGHDCWPEYAPDPALWKQLNRFDVAEAKRLLAEAGYPNGFKVEFMWDNLMKGAGQLDMISDWFGQAGIKLDLEANANDYPAYLQKMYSWPPKHQGITIHRHGLPNMWEYIGGTYLPKGNRNGSGLEDPKLTQMINDAMREKDLAKQKKLVADLELYQLRDLTYVLPWSTGRGYSMAQPWVENWIGWRPVENTYSLQQYWGVWLNK